MTSTTTVPGQTERTADWPFLTAAIVAAGVLVALVLIDGQPNSAALIVLGFALGVTFLKAEFSFTASWRRFLLHGEAGGLLAILLLIALSAVVIVPVAARLPGFGGAIAPIGPSPLIRAFVFGRRMPLAHGCRPGTPYPPRGGSGGPPTAPFVFICGARPVRF